MYSFSDISSSVAYETIVPYCFLYLPPAEDTFIGAGQTGCGFHTAVAFNPIKRMFITATTTS